MSKLFREPLLHFTAAAALIFLAYSLLGRGEETRDTIYVSQGDMERMAALYAAESGALPPPEDMQAMVLDHVETIALAREARRLDLDERDTVVERRLAQKMQFMVDDLTEFPDPDEDTLRQWYQAHADRFTQPKRVTFDHVFFRDADEAGIEAALAMLSGDPASWRQAGDPFLLQKQYGELPIREVVRLFGAEFAAGLDALSPSPDWQGPVKSAFGRHLVRLVSVSEAETPAFEQVRDHVEAEWKADERRRLNAEAVADIIAKYDVVIEGAE